MVNLVDDSNEVCAVPETVSPLSNVADHGPDHLTAGAPDGESASDNRRVPGPDTGSVIDPTQLPAGEGPVKVGPGMGVNVGDTGAESVDDVEPPPQPLNASPSTRIDATGRGACRPVSVRTAALHMVPARQWRALPEV